MNEREEAYATFLERRVLTRLDRMDDRLNKLESRINYLFGGLGVLVLLVNIFDLLRRGIL